MDTIANNEYETLIHIIDGSFEGLLTSVFTAYAKKAFPAGVYVKNEYQQSLYESADEITTDEIKAERVRTGIVIKLGTRIYENVWTAYLSCDPDRFTKIFRYIVLAFAEGRSIVNKLTDKIVFDIFALCRNVGRETCKLTGFIRFSVMENNVQFAEITPEHNQIPLMMQHFADRLQSIPFVIYDSRRCIAGIYDSKEWYIVDAHGLSLPAYAADEEQIRALWKIFYKSIAIEARINLKLQRNLMPKRYWRNMTEHI